MNNSDIWSPLGEHELATLDRDRYSLSTDVLFELRALADDELERRERVARDNHAVAAFDRASITPSLYSAFELWRIVVAFYAAFDGPPSFGDLFRSWRSLQLRAMFNL